VSGTYRVTVAKSYLSFSSAHFITFPGHKCESLHGHNYRVGVTVEGPLDAEALFVIDFAILKAVLKPMVDAIDHKVLLPTAHPRVQLAEVGEFLDVTYFGAPRFRFPRSDCALVPVQNTTAELLAAYFAEAVWTRLRADGFSQLSLIEVEVEESEGQSATYRLPLHG
jgi:6-pyruvoyltetrahydropterin/6-carboxytetrahydropterin synthase